MVKSILRVGILLVVLCVADGQSTRSEDSHCSYTFNVPACDCSYTPREELLLKSSVIALQAHVKLLASKLTDENDKLRQEIATIKADERNTTSEDSRCSCTFKLPASDCSRTPGEDKLLKSSVIALQAQFKLLASKLTDEIEKLRQEIATSKAGAVGGSGRSAVNLKQCSKRGLNYGKENGLAYSCEFVKKRDDTVLRVVWNGDLRLLHNGNKYGSCRRWFFTINGQECSDPRTIDTQIHTHMKGTNMHRPAYVEGYCRGVAAGDVRVAWNIGDCVNGEGWDQSTYNIGDSYAGWVATVRIIVEEVGVEDADNAIV